MRARRFPAINRSRCRLAALLVGVAGLQACAEPAPLPMPERVDLSRFSWPIRADYRIVYVAPDYTSTVVALAGYDPAELVMVPQRW